MRIGELAAESGLSDKALRFYEQIGILDQPDRTPAGYRDYEPTVVDRLTFVRAAQAIGLSLGEIREIIGQFEHKFAELNLEHERQLDKIETGEDLAGGTGASPVQQK